MRLDYAAFGGVSGAGVGVIPQGFAGGLYDAQTGLVRFGARDYDPRVGRWVSKDPIRFDATGTNLYAYALSDPVNVIDSNGLNPIVIIGICAGGGCEALAAAALGVLAGAAWLGNELGDALDDAGVPAPPLVCDDAEDPPEICRLVNVTELNCIYVCRSGLKVRPVPKSPASLTPVGNHNACPRTEVASNLL